MCYSQYLERSICQVYSTILECTRVFGLPVITARDENSRLLTISARMYHCADLRGFRHTRCREDHRNIKVPYTYGRVIYPIILTPTLVLHKCAPMMHRKTKHGLVTRVWVWSRSTRVMCLEGLFAENWLVSWNLLAYVRAIEDTVPNWRIKTYRSGNFFVTFKV
jgi:hypothetical protein